MFLKDCVAQALEDKEWNVLILACNGKVEPQRVLQPGQGPCTLSSSTHAGAFVLEYVLFTGSLLFDVVDCQSTGAYAIRGRYVDQLYKVWSDTVNLPTNTDTLQATKVEKHHIDQAWKVLQRRGRETSKPWRQLTLGRQRASLSDVNTADGATIVDYGR